MDKKQLENIVNASYKDGELNEEFVLSIIDKLNRQELKAYIKVLRKREDKNRVVVTLPFAPEEKEKKMFEKIFAGKKVVFETKPQILIGTRVVNNDIVYDFNLQDSLRKIVSYVSKYD